MISDNVQATIENTEKYSHFETIHILFMLDNVFGMSEDTLSDFAKFMEEEFRDEEFHQLQFYFLLSTSRQYKITFTNSVLDISKIKFSSFKTLFQQMVLKILENNLFPLINLKVIKNLIESFDLYSISLA